MKINLTPHSSLIEKIGHNSFSIGEAISELIANSLNAMPENTLAEIKVEANLDYIKISDNGVGMSKEILIKAVTMAWPMQKYHPNPKTTKSVFGLGMKTACASLGNYWCIMTYTKDSSKAYKVEFDLNSWKKRDSANWDAELEEIEKNELGLPYTSGTIIIIKQLKVKPIGEKIKEDITRAYGPHIKSGDTFFVNAEKLVEKQVDIISESRVEVNITVIGVNIHGWGALAKEGSLTNFGFHWYRKNQLIEAYDKSFIPNHPSYRQITGELFADEMPVNFSKKGFEKESPQWKQAVDELREKFEKLLQEARKTKKQRETNEYTKKELNDSMEILERVGPRIVEIVEANEPTGLVDKNIVEMIEAEGKEDVNKLVGEVSARHPIELGNETIRWRHKFVNLEEDGPIVDYDLEGKNELLILTNIDSPFADLFEDVFLLAVINVAEAISRFLVDKLNYDYIKAMDFKDRWLATSCAIIKEKI